MGETITPDMIQAAYDEEYGAGGEQEYSAAHILMDTEDEAKAIILELTAGADFAELAKAKSTGPSGASGGDLGWFGAGAMVAPFEAAVVALEVGDISPPRADSIRLACYYFKGCAGGCTTADCFGNRKNRRTDKRVYCGKPSASPTEPVTNNPSCGGAGSRLYPQ